MIKRVRMYTDGGARGNPGPAATGVVLYEFNKDGEEGSKICEFGVYLGETTNNQAEYKAIIHGLEKAKELGYNEVDALLDSELAVKQLNGEYRVKNEGLARRVLEIHNLKQSFRAIRFTHIRRAFNTAADAMVNKAIDEALGS
jgi:ribonuclease HI